MKSFFIVLALSFVSVANAAESSQASIEDAVSGLEQSKAPVCTCTGGEGMYPYDCPAIQKTCYGGPGMYPYACWVCPDRVSSEAITFCPAS